MNQPTKIFLLIFSLLTASSYGQSDPTQTNKETVSSDWKERGVTIGADFSNYFYGEIGHYRSYVYEVGGFPIESTLMNYAVEFSYFDKLIIAPKLQARVHTYFFNTSLSSVLYTDLGDCSLKIRPEIGFGLWNFDLNYGYNIGVVNNEFKNINKHTIGLRYYLKLKKKNIHGYDRNGTISE